MRGFTLVEAVMVIVVTGLLAGAVARFIVPSVQAYLATQARAALVDRIDLTMRQVGRELRAALPNSVRINVSGLALEMIPTTGAARYMAEGSNRLVFGDVATSFDLVSPPLTMAAAQQLVFYNLGSGIVGSDAYAPNSSAAEQADSNRRTATNPPGAASTITISSLAGLPVANFASPYRVHAVDAPVSYRCDLASATLTRYTGYGFIATQPDPPATGSSAVLATGVTACRFSHDAAVVASRAALVNLALTLSTTTPGGAENVSLQHALHISNLP